MKKYIFATLLLLIVIPSVSLASWWNPFSWGDKKEISPIETPAEYSPTLESTVLSTETPEPITETKILEKVIEKPVIQTITVQDPTLQAKINALVAENTVLKAEIARLKKVNASLSVELADTEDSLSQTDDSDSDCLDARQEVVDLTNERATIRAKYLSDRAELEKNPSGALLAGLNDSLRNLDRQYSNLVDPIDQKLSIANDEIQLYCY